MSGWLHRRRLQAPIDPLLQTERTVMAWQRTALGFAAVGGLLLHSRQGFSVVVGVLGLVAALALVFLTERRYERIVGTAEGGEPTSRPALMAVLSATAVLLAVAALALVVLPTG
jgi:uncharacterized membrane protein YidH (DUF202 family)